MNCENFKVETSILIAIMVAVQDNSVHYGSQRHTRLQVVIYTALFVWGYSHRLEDQSLYNGPILSEVIDSRGYYRKSIKLFRHSFNFFLSSRQHLGGDDCLRPNLRIILR